MGLGFWNPFTRNAFASSSPRPASPFERQIALPIVYRDRVLDGGFRADIVVSNVLIIEIKSVEAIHPVHEAQLLTYLRLTRHKIGLLMNFNVLRLKDGLRRFVM